MYPKVQFHLKFSATYTQLTNQLLLLVAEFADDKIIFTSNESPIVACQHLQNHLNDMDVWYSNWNNKNK